MSAGRRVVEANLHAEAEAAGHAVSARLLQRLSAAGTLLRAFAAPGDGLWTPAPVERERVAALSWLPRPELLSGATARPVGSARRLAWSHASAALLSRRWQHELVVALREAHAGAAVVADAASLAERLALLGADGGEWVLKPLWSAAGRGLLRGRGGCLLDGTDVRRAPAVRRLLAGDGGLLVEPWVARLADVGCRAEVLPDGRVRVHGTHELLVDAGGRFRGVVLPEASASRATLALRPAPTLQPDEQERLAAVAAAVGAWLARAAYRGPFTVDSYAYRRASGQRAFAALGEVNVRLSFGWVLAALADALRAGPGHDGPLALHFGRGAPPVEARWPLLLPASDGDDTSAWLA